MTALLIYIATLLAFQPGGESTLKGEVVNQQGEPLTGAHIYITELDHGTVSDRNGEFELDGLEAGTYTVQVSIVGFQRKSVEVTIDEDAIHEFRVEMEPITITSGEVTVTAGRRAQMSGKVPVSISTMDATELERRNITSLDESLRYVPGVQVAEEQVNIRGSSGYAFGVGSRVLLLIDGVPLMGPDQGDMEMDAIPMSQVERVEVVKGPGSALYGSGALGGVINLITKDFPEEPETMIRGYSGFYEPAMYDEWQEEWDGASEYRPFSGAVFSHSNAVSDDFGFWVNGTYTDDSGYLENTAEQAFQLYSKIGWKPADGMELDLLAGFRGGRKEQFLYWNGLNDPFRMGRIDFGGNEVEGGNHIQTEIYSILPSFRHFINENFYYTIRGRGYGMAIRPIDDEGDLRDSDQHTTGFRYGAEAEVNWSPDQQQTLIAGATYDDIVAESEFFLGQDSLMLRDQPEYAIFAQYDRDLTRGLTASAGLRYDGYRIDTGDVATQLSPRASISYNITDAWLVRGAFGLGFRAPSVSERFVNNRDFLPLEFNLDLRPEESIGFELGTNYVFRIPELAEVELDATFFRNEYDGLIEPVFQEELEAFQFVNLTEARISGAELELAARDLANNHELHFGYTFLEPEDLTINEPLVYRPRHQIVTGIQSLLPGALSLGIDFRYFSQPERQDSDFNLFVPDADVMEPVYVLDARLARQIQFFGGDLALTATLAVDNALQYYYVERPAFLASPRKTSVRLQIDF